MQVKHIALSKPSQTCMLPKISPSKHHGSTTLPSIAASSTPMETISLTQIQVLCRLLSPRYRTCPQYLQCHLIPPLLRHPQLSPRQSQRQPRLLWSPQHLSPLRGQQCPRRQSRRLRPGMIQWTATIYWVAPRSWESPRPPPWPGSSRSASAAGPRYFGSRPAASRS